MKLIDRFLIKIFFLTAVLFTLVLLDYFNLLSINNIKDKISKNINYIQIAKKVDGKLNLINWGDDVIKVSTEDINTYEKNGILFLNSCSKGAYNRELGSVVKISKNNGLYSVTILSKSNLLYTYSDLEEINVNMYSVVKCNDLIGLARKDDTGYTYGLMVNDEN